MERPLKTLRTTPTNQHQFWQMSLASVSLHAQLQDGLDVSPKANLPPGIYRKMAGAIFCRLSVQWTRHRLLHARVGSP